MKNIFLKTSALAIAFLFAAGHTASSQAHIDNLLIIPANPTEQDSIMIIAYCTFYSGACPLENLSHSITGNVITITAQHCYGMLSIICYSSDTCHIAPLPPGSYTVDFNLMAGTPCPSPMSYQNVDTEQAAFTVTTITNTPGQKANKKQIIHPNPSGGSFGVHCGRTGEKLLIFAPDGRLLEEHKLLPGNNNITSRLAEGLYMAVIQGAESGKTAIPFLIIR
jgi:hypothetical protein